MAITYVSPATGEFVREFPSLTDEQFEQKLQRAHDALRSDLDAR